jgi:hypothetical protein
MAIKILHYHIYFSFLCLLSNSTIIKGQNQIFGWCPLVFKSAVEKSTFKCANSKNFKENFGFKNFNYSFNYNFVNIKA